jgi:heme-degrading monooxygenase HmoA
MGTGKRAGVILLMNDAPTDEEFVAWLHGPHMEEVKRTPGLKRLRRYEVIAGPAGHRKFVGIMECDDLDAALAWRASAESRASQQEADARGIRNRYSVVCVPIYSTDDST